MRTGLRKIAFAAPLAIAAGAWPAPSQTIAQVEFAVIPSHSEGRLKRIGKPNDGTPKSGDRLQVWLSASAPIRALTVAFDSAGHVAFPDQPLLVTLNPGAEQALPLADGWKWDAQVPVRELDVLFVDARSPAMAALAQLVDATHASVPPAVRTRQVGELRKTIDSLTQRDASNADFSLKTEPVLLAGLVRGMRCSWCDAAPKFSIPAGGSYLVRHRFQ